MAESMIDRAQRLIDEALEQRDGTIRERLEEIGSGAGVQRDWLEKFRHDKIRDPGVRKVEGVIAAVEAISKREHWPKKKAA